MTACSGARSRAHSPTRGSSSPRPGAATSSSTRAPRPDSASLIAGEACTVATFRPARSRPLSSGAIAPTRYRLCIVAMLSYAHGAIDEPLLGETIGANLERTIERHPGAEALVSVHQGFRYTYAQFGHAVDRLAGGLLKAGLEPGDRVGVSGPNRAEW